MSYLEEAAEQLRKVVANIDRDEKRIGLGLDGRRQEVAEKFAELAAIEKGTIPARLAEHLLHTMED
jgi:hypothetical protein